MELLVFVVFLVAAVGALYVAADRARTLVVCAVDGGRVRIVRGRISAEALSEIADVVSRARLRSGRVVVRKEDGAVMVRVRGIDDKNAVQQLRNAIGRFSLARLRG